MIAGTLMVPGYIDIDTKKGVVCRHDKRHGMYLTTYVFKSLYIGLCTIIDIDVLNPMFL